MRIVRPKEIAWAAVVVFGFWWLVLFVVGGQRYASLMDVLHSAGAWIFGIAAGFAVAMVWYKLDRSVQIESLVPDSWNGASATLGKVPIHHERLSASSEFPTAEQLAEHMPAEVIAAGESSFLHDWIAATHVRAPGHTELLKEIVKVLWHERVRAWPATHADDPLHNHGGRTLLTHSLLVCWLTLREKKSYVYVPAKAPSGYQLIKLRDANYRFDTEDPLIPILGLGHDLGKIECYVWEDDKLVDCTKDHDLVGARIMARMENYWHQSIPPEDLDTMQPILAHYHHPSAMPMAADGGVISDRTHALLELLIRCDRIAGAMEHGRSRASLAQQEERSQEFEETGQRSSMKQAIVEVLSRTGRVNSKDIATNVGIKYTLPQYRKAVVVLKEDVFIKQVAEVADLQEVFNQPVSGTNPVNALTREVLIWLGEQGLLFTDHEPSGRAAESSLYKVSFYRPDEYFEDKEKTIPVDTPSSPKFSWGSCILLAPEALDELVYLSALDDYWVVPHFSVARTGGQGAFRKKSEQEQVAQAEANNDFLSNLAKDFPALEEKEPPAAEAQELIADQVTEGELAMHGPDQSVSFEPENQVGALSEADDLAMYGPDQMVSPEGSIDEGQENQVAAGAPNEADDLAMYGPDQTASPEQGPIDEGQENQVAAEADYLAMYGPEPGSKAEPLDLGEGALFRMHLLAAAASGDVQQKDLGKGLLALYDLEPVLEASGWTVDALLQSSEEWRSTAQIVWVEHKLVKALGRVGLVVTLRQ